MTAVKDDELKSALHKPNGMQMGQKKKNVTQIRLHFVASMFIDKVIVLTFLL